MRIYDIAFYFCAFFLIGVLLYSLKINILIIIFLAASAAIFILLWSYLRYLAISSRMAWMSGLGFIIIIGALYAAFYNYEHATMVRIDFDKEQVFKGLVIADPVRGQSQKLKVALHGPQVGNVLATLQSYPQFNYGDLVEFSGTIQAPDPGNYAEYLKKENIYGISTFPKTKLISVGNGLPIYSSLFALKNQIISVFQKTLNEERSTFMVGLALGAQVQFSKELQTAMSQSGTTHLVALSGYNISIISWTIAALLGLFLSRRWSFIFSVIIIIGFVMMAGAQASVVRAAIMGIIFLIAGQVGRAYSLRNAIILAAFFMVLFNPLLLRFDAGFQLSFLALIGLVYLGPAIKQALRIKSDFDFLSFRENFLATLSAQLMVVPLLIMNFSNFSPVSLVTNVLILSFVPITMALGFITGFLGLFSYSLSLIGGWLVNLPLAYELGVIKFFGSLNVMRIESLSIYLAVLYYAVLVGFIVYTKIFRECRTFV